MYKIVTKEEVNNWVELNKQLTVTEISKLVGRNYKTIYSYFKSINYIPDTHMSRVYKKKYSDNEIFEIHKHFTENKKLTLKELSINFKISENSLWKRFKKLELPTKGFKWKHKDINDSFFTSIDSEIKAYLLGFFAADGHIEKRRDYYSYTLRISIHKKDSEILEMYKKYISNDLCNIRKTSSPNLLQIGINSIQIGEDLLKLGYNNRKTYTCKSLPNISNEMMRHFIRGYFDGDGSIMFNRDKNGNCNRNFVICSFTDEILKQIISYLPIINKVYYNYISEVTMIVNGKVANFKGASKVSIRDKASLKLIYNYLYNDSNFFLNRKKEKFEQSII